MENQQKEPHQNENVFDHIMFCLLEMIVITF